ncbi:MAG TPA: alginate export family protein, partial [Candidatus Polarisedimenticolia bacterium]|nr:alginate export family protein [Candidatus Polarisedimenticolia bacterium]
MKKFLTMFLFAAALASAFSFILAAEEDDATMGEKKFVLHGEIRQRADYNDNLSDFTSDSPDSFLFFPYRARIAAEGHFTNDIVGYVEFQNFGYWGDVPPIKGFQFGPVFGDNVTGPSNPPFGPNTNVLQNVQSNAATTLNDVELYQAYIGLHKIGGTIFSLNLGRQEIVKGTEMLLGDNDFYSGVSHDGAVGCFAADHFDLDIWWTRPLQSGGLLANPDHQSVNFYGAWLDWNRYDSGLAWAAYLLNYEDGSSSLGADRRQFWTIGGRADREVTDKSGFFFNAELAIQKGEYSNGPGLGDTGDIKAMGWEGMLGYNFHGDHDNRIWISYDMASGDDDPADTDAEFFDPLFQDSHGRYGLSDIFTFSNLTVWNIGYSMIMNDRHSWGVDYFNQSETEDLLVAGEDQLGQEVDGWWKFQYTPNTQIMAGAVWFDPGDAI